jgi:1-deoxy-D-xylulose-5-phosphate reductoisomerase
MSLEKKKVVVLGSTGSIGRQTLDVIDKQKERFELLGIAARDEVELLAEQARQHQVNVIAVGDALAYKEMRQEAAVGTTVLSGLEGLCQLAAWPTADLVVIALSGAIGIEPTLAALKAGKRVALANKETLVAAGDIVMEQARQYEAELIPVDSEHSAVFQCIKGEERYLKRIWLTASGGPFKALILSRTDASVVLYILILAALITSAAFSPHLGVSKALTSVSTTFWAALIPAPPWLAAALLSINLLSFESVS